MGFLKGGYVGVDVFFVLSGFLITGLLLSEARGGGVSLADFYQRRARRILPAAALTLVVTDVVAYHLLNFVRARQIMWDSISASVFAANVHFAQRGTDYFARAQPPSPIQHFWTLAVEEQFYLVWPALLTLVLFGVAVSHRTRHERRLGLHASTLTARGLHRLLFVVIVAAAASLAWSIHSTDVLPTSAYFSTFARAWELALGALLAISVTWLMRAPAASLAVIGWLGLIGIAAAGVIYSSSTPFPGQAALLPTVGAALVIAAGASKQQPRLGVGRLLALRPLRYVGDRSYTFYLWHWPVLIIALQYEGHELSLPTKLLLLGAAFLLSMVTYACYENPIRRMNWSGAASAFAVSASVAAVVLLAAFTISSIDARDSRLTAAATSGGAALFDAGRAASDADRVESADVSATDAGRPLRDVVASVRASERGERIPRLLTPSVGELEGDRYVYPNGCATQEGQTSSDLCRLGDRSSGKSILIVGDSHAQMWMPAVLYVARRDGYAVIPLGKYACTPSEWVGSGDRECQKWYRWALGQAKKLRPDITLVGGSYGSSDLATQNAAVRGIRAVASSLRSYSGKVVVIADPPGEKEEPVDCLLARAATMARCTNVITPERKAQNRRIRAALSSTRGLGYLDTDAWFCSSDRCPMVIGSTIAYRDKSHVSKTYGKRLAEPFRHALRTAIGARPSTRTQRFTPPRVGSTSGPGSALPATRVTITSSGLDPAWVTVKARSYILWSNVDARTHVVQFRHGECRLRLAPGESNICRPAVPGTHAYSVSGLEHPADAQVVVTGRTRTPRRALDLNVSSTIAVYGGDGVVLSGHASGHPATRGPTAIDVFAKPVGARSFVRVARPRGKASGSWQYLAKPRVTTTFAAAWHGTVSEIAVVKVRPRVVLRRLESRRRNYVLRLRVRAARSLAGRRVQLRCEARAPGRILATVRLGPHSSTRTVISRRAGCTAARAVLQTPQAAPDYVGSWSGLVVLPLESDG